LSACADQATAQPTTLRFGVGLSYAFGPFSLTTVRQQFRCLSPARQPSASATASVAHTRLPHGRRMPANGRLHDPGASHKTVASPARPVWLQGAETQVRSEDPPNNYLRGLRRVTQSSPCWNMSLIEVNLHSLRAQIRLVLSLLRPRSGDDQASYLRDSCRTLGKLQFYH
jgi:hypothetical protein